MNSINACFSWLIENISSYLYRSTYPRKNTLAAKYVRIPNHGLSTPAALMPVIVIIETVSSIIRPAALSVRLAANMIADPFTFKFNFT